MRSRSVFILSAMVVTACAALALAQQRPEGQPGGRGGRGGGPPGGGAFTNRLGLLRSPEVRKELELVDEQIAAIEKIEEELQAKYPFGGRGGGAPGGRGDGKRGPGRGDNNNEAARAVPASWYFVQAAAQNQPGQGRRGGGGPQLSEEDRARFEQQRLDRSREEKAKLAEVLLPDQLKRLTEIYIQQAGIYALRDEDVASELKITAAQQAQMAEMRRQNQQALDAAIGELFRGGGGGGGDNDAQREANRAKLDEMRKANDAKLLAVLSADQQKQFEQMKGKPFAMPEGPGRGGPPGGNRGRRPGNDNSK